MSFTQVSARFFLELGVGLMACPLLLDRRVIGKGFVRFMALLALASGALALMLHGEVQEDLPTWSNPRLLTIVFVALSAAILALAGALPRAADQALLGAALAAGIGALAASVNLQLPDASALATSGFVSGAVLSAGVLGLVTGAMILGHWYLVTPELPIGYLGTTTRAALIAVYAKTALVVLTMWLNYDLFESSIRSLGSVLGVADAPAGTGFQQQLDCIYLLARLFIGLVGPAVLCHMTMKTVALRATQPATGILYAATILVLMGELFALLGEQSFDVIL